jgi:DNA-binding LacI/PurR family transcriptional regulator
MPNIKDVAKAAGVSIATVSYVLNNKSAFYSEKTRLQVLEAVQRVGYTPNATAQNLKSSQTRLIGYAYHHVPQGQVNAVLDQFTYFLAQEAEAAGYHVLTFTYPLDDPIPVYDELIRKGKVDAFAIASTTTNDPRIRYLLNQNFPFVSFGRANADWDFSWVDTDGEYGVRMAMEYLRELGHERIAMIGWPEESISGSFRMDGYLQALKSANMLFHPAYILRDENSEQSGRRAVAQWMELPEDERPTAVIAIDDLVAIGVMNEAIERGLPVGETFAVIGFDDTPLGQYLRPSLTTLRQPIIDICHELITTLEDVIQNRLTESRQLLLSPELIIRESSGKPL